MLLNLTNFSAEPIHMQIVEQILHKIINNELYPGDEIISYRKLSRQQHIGKTTAAKAYKELEQMEIIKSISEEKFVINNITKEQLIKFSKQKRMNKFSTKEEEKLNTELEAARQIQRDMLPTKLPNNEKISVSAYSSISTEVGGDFYDFFKIDKDKFGFLIGDASGKGLPAALLISQIQAILKSDISHTRSLNQTFNLLNTYFKINSGAKNFATLFYGILNLKTGKIKYANAGHNFPIIIRDNSAVEVLKTTGPAIGIMLKAKYEEKTIIINKNDLIILFTDGVSETMNSENIQFGENRIIEYCKKHRNKSTHSLIYGLKNKLNTFGKINYDNDDTTLMAIKINIDYRQVQSDKTNLYPIRGKQ